MATLNFVLKKILKNKDYYIYIRISHANLSAKYLSLHLRVKQSDWDKQKQRFKRTKVNHDELNSTLNDIEVRAESIISELIINDRFSFAAFKRAYNRNEKSEVQTVNDLFIEKLDQLKLTKRYGTYRAYNNCYASLQKFTSLSILIAEIDFRFLKDFELYHIKLGNKPNTYGAYFRALRAIHYEYCKLNDIVEPGIYKRFNISRIKNEVRKRSLSKEQLRRFINYTPPSESQAKAKLLFLFSFYARGINLMDMLQLTDENIEGDVLMYRRQKTGKEMRIMLVSEALRVLDYFRNNTGFLFPYLSKGDIPKFRISDVNRNINRRLALIGKEIGISKLTMYYARHTFAELHYKAGIRIEIISQMLGHSDLKTTQTYLRSFSDDEVDSAANKVFDSL